ncbi:MAG: hypothetical protein ACYCO0_02580 [Candidatus Micrarchaeaceae archaeon]
MSQIKFGDHESSLKFVGNGKSLQNLIDAINAICPDKMFVDLTSRDKELLMMMVRPIKFRND